VAEYSHPGRGIFMKHRRIAAAVSKRDRNGRYHLV
jgi:hypothetical protein